MQAIKIEPGRVPRIIEQGEIAATKKICGLTSKKVMESGLVVFLNPWAFAHGGEASGYLQIGELRETLLYGSIIIMRQSLGGITSTRPADFDTVTACWRGISDDE